MKVTGVIILFLLAFPLVFASFEVHNTSIDSEYPLNQFLKGSMNITIDREPVDVLFTSNRDQSGLLYDLLKANAVLPECDPYDCENRFVSKNASESVSFSLASYGTQYVGFALEGDDVAVESIDFSLSSDFSDGLVIPISLEYFENADLTWTFDQFGDKVRTIDYGTYISSARELGPFLRSNMYCMRHSVYETDRLLVGVEFMAQNDSEGLIEVVVYDDGGSEVIRGEIDPFAQGNEPPLIDNVVLNGFDFSSGNYYVCVRAKDGDSTYQLYKDVKSTKKSGFSFQGDTEFGYDEALQESTVNYGIFIREYKYAGADKLSSANYSVDTSFAQDYIDSKYGGDCTDTCYLPIRVRAGVGQTVGIDTVSVNYIADNVDKTATKVHLFDKVSGLMSYSGVLDLRGLDFIMNESETYKFYIDDEKIAEVDVTITPAPLIQGVYPRFIPAGVDSRLFADVLFDGDNATLTYEWDFGDGSSTTSDSPYVYHRYSNISTFKVKLNVSSTNYSNSFEQEIQTINPRDYVTVFFDLLSGNLNQTKDEIKSFPEWEHKFLTSSVKVLEVGDELSRIDRKIREAVDPDDYLEVSSMINALDVPAAVRVTEEFPLIVAGDDVINLDAITEYTAESLDSGYDEEDYFNAVRRWQTETVSYTGSVKKVSLFRTSGVKEDLLTHYILTISHEYPEESFLVLDIPYEQVEFNSLDASVKSGGGATIIPLSSGTTTVEFYIPGNQEINYFVTPWLKDLYGYLEALVNEDCNFNYVCEDGEDYTTCRSDCKPVFPMIWFILLAFLFGLVMYTILQIWYDKHYEHQLFPDSNRLYNVMVFVIAAQSQGMTRDEIKKSLQEKGWTNERIEFVLRKANGERTGMYELIPLSKITAAHRKKEVKENYHGPLINEHENNFPSPHSRPQHIPPRKMHPAARHSHLMGPSGATNPQQQNQRNINKGDERNLNRGR